MTDGMPRSKDFEEVKQPQHLERISQPDKAIPKRWESQWDRGKQDHVFVGGCTLQTVIEQLGAAEARVRELEQERGADGTNWFPESFVSQLQSQLAAVTQERDTLKSDIGVYAKCQDKLQSRFVQLRARNKERDAWEGIAGQNAEAIAQLQARNIKLREAIQTFLSDAGRWGATYTILHAALTEEEAEP